MSMSGIPTSGGRAGRRRRGGKKALMSEINVTPMVDVMLVLLIIFMVSAPLLVTGIPLDLPKTVAGALTSKTPPLTISIDANGNFGVNEEKYSTVEDVIAKLEALKKQGVKAAEEPIVFKADKTVSYESIMNMLANMQKAGFTKINLGSAAKVK